MKTIVTRLLAVAAIALSSLCSALPPIKRGALIGGATPQRTAPAASARTRTKPAAKAPAASTRKTPPQTGKSAAAGMGPLVPYRSAVAIDAVSGRILFADHDARASYPASVTKLMTFLLVLEDVKEGRYTLKDRAAASTYASSMEPSSVGIKPRETMTIEDLLYSIMVKSANDAAIVLAEHAAWVRSGGKGTIPDDAKGRDRVEAFVARMNLRAHELGMTATRYASPNGLPPARTEKRGFDTSTAADIAKLCQRIVKQAGALKYTSCAVHTVTDGAGKPLTLATHNYFLPGSRDKEGCARPVEGCDGLKTGYTAVSGSSIALTAARNGRRVIVVVLGSAGRHNREAAAGSILRDALGAISVW